MNNIYKYLTIVFSIIILTLLLKNVITSNKLEKIEESNRLNQLYSKEIEKKYNSKLKSYVLTKESLESDKKNLQKIVKEKDKEIYNIIKKTKSKIVIKFKDSIRIDTVYKNNVILYGDGKFQLRDTINNKFYQAIINANNDSTKFSLKAYNERTVFFTREKNKTILNVKDNNPYLQVQNMNSFIVKDKPKNYKFITGVLIGFGTSYLLFK